jgi:Ca2+-transporting ATPase
MGTYLFGAARYGIGPQASTMAFLSLASAQLLHALTLESSSPNIFNAGSKPVNRYIPWALGIGFVSELAAAVVPGIGGLLGAARIGFLDTLLCFLSAGVSFACNETLKHTRNNGAPWRLALSAPQACS